MKFTKNRDVLARLLFFLIKTIASLTFLLSSRPRFQ